MLFQLHAEKLTKQKNEEKKKTKSRVSPSYSIQKSSPCKKKLRQKSKNEKKN